LVYRETSVASRADFKVGTMLVLVKMLATLHTIIKRDTLRQRRHGIYTCIFIAPIFRVSAIFEHGVFRQLLENMAHFIIMSLKLLFHQQGVDLATELVQTAGKIVHALANLRRGFFVGLEMPEFKDGVFECGGFHDTRSPGTHAPIEEILSAHGFIRGLANGDGGGLDVGRFHVVVAELGRLVQREKLDFGD